MRRAMFIFIFAGSFYFFGIESMSPSKKAILFDLDGTLIQTQKKDTQVFFTLLKEHNIAISHDIEDILLNELPGQSLERTCSVLQKIIFDEKGYEISFNELEMYINTAYLAIKKTITAFVPGFHELYSCAQQCGLKMGIVTNASREEVAIIEKNLRLSHYFGENIICIDDVSKGRGKPHPDLYLLGAQKIDCHPSEIIVFEDSQTGINSALKAGMYVIGLETSGNPHDVSKAHKKIKNFKGLSIQKLVDDNSYKE